MGPIRWPPLVRRRRHTAVVASVWLALALSAQAPTSLAQAPPAPSASASVSASPTASPTASATASASAAPDAPPAPDQPEDVAALVEKAKRVRAFVADELAADVDPLTLFDVDVQDARALAVEVERLRRVLREAEAQAAGGGEPTAGAGGGKPPPPKPPKAPKAPVPAGQGGAGEGGAAAEGGAAPVAPKADPDPTLLEARLELDRARLAFYELSAEERAARFDAHRERRAKSSSAKAKEELSEAERDKREAAAERARAEEEARKARSNAERLVAEERVRLLGVKESQASLSAVIARKNIDLAEFDETLLAWQRPADTVLKAPETKRPKVAEIDGVYDELATHLVDIRTRLDASISTVNDAPDDLERVGDDPLISLAVEVDRSTIDTLRKELLDEETRLIETSGEQRIEEMRHLQRAMESLDKRRLELIPLISADKRSELQGFGPVALTQARKEISHLTLLLRYHLHESRRFVSSVRETGETGGSAFVATITALKWMLPIGLFIWWRRRAEETLDGIRKNARDARRKNRRDRRRDPSRVERIITFYKRVRSPIEWLVLVWAVIALLPEGAEKQLEVQLLWTTLRWTLGGQLVVQAIDALFAEESTSRRRESRLQTAHLRFKTLRLIGRVVVTFGLILALTSDLVGEGTIYSWATTANYIIAIPVALVIVAWWRNVIFHHVELQRKKGPILKWIDETKEGWQTFPAAVAGGVWLLGHNIAKFTRSRVLSIDIVKRVLAYWFRREVTKQSEARKSLVQDAELSDETYLALHPAREADEVVASVADEQMEGIIAHVRRKGGAVYAVVGERGAGKTTLMKRIEKRTPDTLHVVCPVEGISGFHKALREALGLAEDATDDEVSTLLNKGSGDNALLIDDAQHLVHPVVDGLEELDRILALARRSSVSCTWVFAFDSIIWSYFSRAREVRPLFDDIIRLKPWSEEGIVRLLRQRSEAAGVDPDFSRLIGDLPDDADEQDAIEALERARNGYFRLLWDYSLGNPAVSLHFWRASLRVAPNGDHIVRLFEPPATTDLERLPDSAVFVLRAIVQLDEASIEDIADATFLGRTQVEDAIRYALVRRYVEQVGDRVRVRWTWFRTITRFLARRHLLVSPDQS